MMKNKDKCMLDDKYDYMDSELDSLLQTSCSTSGIPEPALLNHIEESGNFIVYLSSLSKQNGCKNGNS